MLEICIQTSYDQNVQLILKSYLPLVYGTTLNYFKIFSYCKGNKTFPMYQFIPEYLTLTNTNLYTGRRLAKLYLMIMPTNKYGHHHNELNNKRRFWNSLRWYHTLQGDNSLKSVERFDHMMFVCRFQASRWSQPQHDYNCTCLQGYVGRNCENGTYNSILCLLQIGNTISGSRVCN
jgi:hypothetical protein